MPEKIETIEFHDVTFRYEDGTHEELLKQRGHYYSLYTSQFRREREEEVLSGEET